LIELSGEPAYLQVANDLRRQIRKGSMPTGTRLPSTTQLMATYGHSSTVIKAAINELRADGLVVGQQGKGVFVRDPSGAGDRPGGSDQFRVLMAQVQTLMSTTACASPRSSSTRMATSAAVSVVIGRGSFMATSTPAGTG
jgi:DNA-binding GntR family transcriptional regulator